MKNKLKQFLNEDCLSIESDSRNFYLHITNKFLVVLAIPTIFFLTVVIVNAL